MEGSSGTSVAIGFTPSIVPGGFSVILRKLRALCSVFRRNRHQNLKLLGIGGWIGNNQKKGSLWLPSAFARHRLGERFMGTAGKTLAILNVLAGIGFVCMAALDYGQRQAWSFQVLAQDFVLKGLPVDEDEKDVEGQPLVSLCGDKTRMQKQLFSGVQGPAVPTQRAEVKNRHDALKDKIQQEPNDEAKRKLLEATLVPLATTLGDREELRRHIQADKIDDLLEPDGPFEAPFKEALAGKVAVQSGAGAPSPDLEREQRRQGIAHLLVGSAQDNAEYQRALVIVGASHFARELESQSVSLGEMVPKLQLVVAGDRATFQTEHKVLLQQIIALADRVRDAEDTLEKHKVLLQKHRNLVDSRQQDAADLTKRIAAAKVAYGVALQRQSELEKQLFAADAAVAAEEAKNERLEREVKTQELSSEGGK